MKRVLDAVQKALDGYFNLNDPDGAEIHRRLSDHMRCELSEVVGWISVKDRLPQIPKGMYGVSVIVATFDPVLAEDGKNGYTVTDGHYGSLRDREGKLLPAFEGTTKEFDFKDLHNGAGKVYWGPTADQVRFWMPMPEHPPTGIEW